MSNNKFHFEFKKRISKIQDFFFFHVQKRNYNCVEIFPHKLFVRFGEPSPHGFVTKGWVRSSGIPCLCPRAYKACVGRSLRQCGTEDIARLILSSHPFVTKPCGFSSPKRTNSLCGKIPTQKGTFEGMCPIKSIVRFGARVGLALLCPHRMIPTRLCYPSGARLYHYSHAEQWYTHGCSKGL